MIMKDLGDTILMMNGMIMTQIKFHMMKRKIMICGMMRMQRRKIGIRIERH